MNDFDRRWQEQEAQVRKVTRLAIAINAIILFLVIGFLAFVVWAGIRLVLHFT